MAKHQGPARCSVDDVRHASCMFWLMPCWALPSMHMHFKCKAAVYGASHAADLCKHGKAQSYYEALFVSCVCILLEGLK
jgi:hypothetical protein